MGRSSHPLPGLLMLLPLSVAEPRGLCICASELASGAEDVLHTQAQIRDEGKAEPTVVLGRYPTAGGCAAAHGDRHAALLLGRSGCRPLGTATQPRGAARRVLGHLPGELVRDEDGRCRHGLEAMAQAMRACVRGCPAQERTRPRRPRRAVHGGGVPQPHEVEPVAALRREATGVHQLPVDAVAGAAEGADNGVERAAAVALQRSARSATSARYARSARSARSAWAPRGPSSRVTAIIITYDHCGIVTAHMLS
jgi:hypothetical protein